MQQFPKLFLAPHHMRVRNHDRRHEALECPGQFGFARLAHRVPSRWLVRGLSQIIGRVGEARFLDKDPFRLMALVDGEGLAAVGPEPHFRHRLVAEIAQELRTPGLNVRGLELEDHLQGIPFAAVIGEGDQIGRTAGCIFLAALALSQIVRRVRHLPFGLPPKLGFLPSKPE